MAIELKILAGGLSENYFGGLAGGHYQNSQPSIDLKNEKEKKKWRKIFNLTEKQFDEAIAKFGNKLRDLRLGLRGSE